MNSSIESIEYTNYLVNIREIINANFNIISPAIGIPCNIISIFIFARLMKNKNNMGYLYVWQCSIDLLVLLFSLLILRSSNTFGINISFQSDFSCKILNFLRRFLLHASSWISVLTTFDRFTFVLYGHGDRFRFLKSKLNITWMILAMFAIISVLDAPNFLFYLRKKRGFVVACDADFAAVISTDIISNLMRLYLPFTIMAVFNLLMIQKIFRNNRNVTKQISNSSARKETQFTVAVIASDVYFFVFNFPLTVFYILYDINFYSGAFRANYLTLFHASYTLAIIITGNLAYFDQTFSFFMYFSCNKLFRNEIFHLIGSRFNFSIDSSKALNTANQKSR